jgi:hypothetical protein
VCSWLMDDCNVIATNKRRDTTDDQTICLATDRQQTSSLGDGLIVLHVEGSWHSIDTTLIYMALLQCAVYVNHPTQQADAYFGGIISHNVETMF